MTPPGSFPEVSGSTGRWLPPGLRDRARPSVRLRLRAFWKTLELHEALAAGTDPLASEELLWRAQKLVEPKKRVGFADLIERIVDDVGRGGLQMTPGPQIVTREAIKDNRSLLRVLAERLRSDGPHALRGLALTDLLVCYGDSPLYRARSPLALKRELLAIIAALDPAESRAPARGLPDPDVSRRTAKSLHPALWGPMRPGLRVRLRTSWRAAELDEALAAGANPLESDELLWRAQQLAEPMERIAIAGSIARLVAEVAQGGSELSPEPQLVEHELIKANRSLLLVLSERLRSAGPHDLRGLAMADLLVHYGDSPLYCERSPLALRSKLFEVLEALDPARLVDGRRSA